MKHPLSSDFRYYLISYLITLLGFNLILLNLFLKIEFTGVVLIKEILTLLYSVLISLYFTHYMIFSRKSGKLLIFFSVLMFIFFLSSPRQHWLNLGIIRNDAVFQMIQIAGCAISWLLGILGFLKQQNHRKIDGHSDPQS